MIDDSINLDNLVIKQYEATKRFKEATLIIPPELLWLEVTCNEKFLSGVDLERLNQRTIEAARVIKREGYRPIGFNIAVGNIAKIAGATVDGVLYNVDSSEMNDIASGVEELNYLDGAINYHNYTVPTRQLDTWLDLRHERMAEELPPETKWWLGEGLFDHGIIGMPLAGWNYVDFHIDAEFTARYLRRIAQRLSADKRVIGFTPFGAGSTSDWWTFKYDDQPVITQVFTELYEVGDLHMVAPVVGQGLRRMITYLGQPLENEVYHFPGTPMETSLAVFENGTATWYKAANLTIGIRSDGALFTDRGNDGDGASVWQVYP